MNEPPILHANLHMRTELFGLFMQCVRLTGRTKFFQFKSCRMLT